MKVTFDISSLSPLEVFRYSERQLLLEFEKRITLGNHLQFFITIEDVSLPTKPGQHRISGQISLLVNEKLRNESAFKLAAKQFGVSIEWLYTVTERCANEYERTAHLLLTTLPQK